MGSKDGERPSGIATLVMLVVIVATSVGLTTLTSLTGVPRWGLSIVSGMVVAAIVEAALKARRRGRSANGELESNQRNPKEGR